MTAELRSDLRTILHQHLDSQTDDVTNRFRLPLKATVNIAPDQGLMDCYLASCSVETDSDFRDRFKRTATFLAVLATSEYHQHWEYKRRREEALMRDSGVSQKTF